MTRCCPRTAPASVSSIHQIRRRTKFSELKAAINACNAEF
jgi:hypothetical protein